MTDWMTRNPQINDSPNLLGHPVYAITIHKSQGQTFEYVGIDLTADVFNHSQLYVSFSRAKKWFEDIAKQELANAAKKCGLERNSI